MENSEISIFHLFRNLVCAAEVFAFGPFSTGKHAPKRGPCLQNSQLMTFSTGMKYLQEQLLMQLQLQWSSYTLLLSSHSNIDSTVCIVRVMKVPYISPSNGTKLLLTGLLSLFASILIFCFASLLAKLDHFLPEKAENDTLFYRN